MRLPSRPPCTTRLPEVISKDRYDEFGPVSIHDAIAPFLHVPTAEQMCVKCTCGFRK
ncbi:MAG: hypothetical protein Q8P67_13815 [archaeon]|nr:hypothetical protein [archaeon]